MVRKRNRERARNKITLCCVTVAHALALEVSFPCQLCAKIYVACELSRSSHTTVGSFFKKKTKNKKSAIHLPLTQTRFFTLGLPDFCTNNSYR